MAYGIEERTRTEYKETKHGRTRESQVTTWDVVDLAACSLRGEYSTRREALERLAELEASAASGRIAVERGGRLLGWVEPYYVTVRFRQNKRPEWFAILPDGRKTDFTLPTRKQATEWLEGASR